MARSTRRRSRSHRAWRCAIRRSSSPTPSRTSSAPSSCRRRTRSGRSSAATCSSSAIKDGFGDSVRLQHPLGVARAGDRLFIADTYNHRIKSLDPSQAHGRRVCRQWRCGPRRRPRGASRSSTSPAGLSATTDSALRRRHQQPRDSQDSARRWTRLDASRFASHSPGPTHETDDSCSRSPPHSSPPSSAAALAQRPGHRQRNPLTSSASTRRSSRSRTCASSTAPARRRARTRRSSSATATSPRWAAPPRVTVPEGATVIDRHRQERDAGPRDAPRAPVLPDRPGRLRPARPELRAALPRRRRDDDAHGGQHERR